MVFLFVLCLVGCSLLLSINFYFCLVVVFLQSYQGLREIPAQDDGFDRNEVEQARRFLDSKRPVYRHLEPLRPILPIGLRDPAQLRRQALDTSFESSP